MAESLGYYTRFAGQAFTGLLGASIPASIIWEVFMPPSSDDENILVAFVEGCITIIGCVMTTAILAETFNPFVEDLGIEPMFLLIAPYYVKHAIAKMRMCSHAIRDVFTLYTPRDEQ